MKAIQDYYSESFSHCYGCGRLNKKGHQIKTVWDGDETLTRFTPKPEHTAIPGLTYGGLIASLIDCHGTGSASLALVKELNIKLEGYNAPRCVTASLKVNYKKPTPIDGSLEIRGKISEIKGKKVVVEARLISNSEVTVTGQIIAIHVGDSALSERETPRKQWWQFWK
ncbi:PaaI family thioesterase [Bacteroidota bacterium]